MKRKAAVEISQGQLPLKKKKISSWQQHLKNFALTEGKSLCVDTMFIDYAEELHACRHLIHTDVQLADGKNASNPCDFTKQARTSYQLLSEEERRELLDHNKESPTTRMTKSEVLKRGRTLFSKMDKIVML